MKQKTTNKRTAPAPKVAAASPAEAQPKPRELAPIQQFIADEVADMLIRGADKGDDLDSLLWVALANSKRRFLFNYEADKQKVEQQVRDTTLADFKGHQAELLIAIHQNQLAPPADKVEPKTATARIRARLLETLRDNFEAFLHHGTPEERQIMHEVLISHSSVNKGSDNFDELPLAKAFDEEIGKGSREYIRVPSAMREQVNCYVECLVAANARDRKPAA
jgi:hypothetical protein